MIEHRNGSVSGEELLTSRPGTKNESSARAAGNAPTAILVVDDDEWLRGLVVAVLRSNGYVVHEASSGGAALDLLRTHVGHDVSMLLSDVVLPGMNGYALADVLRRDRPGLPVLLMTGRLPALLPEGDAGMGFGRILQKPFTPEGLLHAVSERLAVKV